MTRTAFAAKKVENDLVIDVFDFIGSDFFGEGITAKSIAKVLASFDKPARIVVRLNSPGGDVFDSHTIYSLLRAESAKGVPVRTEIHGLAASGASIIALAGDEVVMADGAMYMIHNPWSMAFGESEDMKHTAEVLDKIKESMLDIYMRRANISRAKVSDMMDDETWMSPTEAIKYGFADAEISADVVAGALAQLATQDRTYATLSRYQHTPHNVLNTFYTVQGDALVCAMKQSLVTPTASQSTMTPEQIRKLLGLASNATDAEVEQKISALNAASSAVGLADAVPRADYDRKCFEAAELKAKVERDANDAFEKDLVAALDKAQTEGRISPASRAYHVKTCHRGKTLDEKRVALQEFQEYAAAQPALVSDDQMKAAADARVGERSTVAATSEICEMLGVTPEEMAKARADMKAKPKVYNPEAYRTVLQGGI